MTHIHSILRTAGYLQTRRFRVCKAYGLLPEQYDVLAILSAAERPLMLKDIKAKMYCEGSNITRIVDKMFTAGLVNRFGNDDDRRRKNVSITAEGEHVFEVVTEALDKAGLVTPRMGDQNEATLEMLLGMATSFAYACSLEATQTAE